MRRGLHQCTVQEQNRAGVSDVLPDSTPLSWNALAKVRAVEQVISISHSLGMSFRNLVKGRLAHELRDVALIACGVDQAEGFCFRCSCDRGSGRSRKQRDQAGNHPESTKDHT